MKNIIEIGTRIEGVNEESLGNRRRFILTGTASLAGTMLFRPGQGFAQIRDFGMLPPIRIYPGSSNLDPISGLGPGGEASAVAPPPGAPPANLDLIGPGTVANGTNLFRVAATGDPVATLNEFFKGISGTSAANVFTQIRYVGTFTQWLAAEGYRQMIGADRFAMSSSDVSGISTLFGLYASQANGLQPIQEFAFYGNPLMPIAGIYYWIAGNGNRRSMDVRTLNLDMGIADFKSIRDMVDNPSMGPGKYNIDSAFSTNVFSHPFKDLWAAGTLGRIGGQVQGTLTLNADNSYSFDGSYTLQPDVFDADASHRPFPQEALTDFLRAIGDLFGKKDYTIVFTGSKGVTFSGVRNIPAPVQQKQVVQPPEPQNPTGPRFIPRRGGMIRP